MNTLDAAKKAVLNLGEAEIAKAPYQSQIDAFQQNPDTQMKDQAQSAFEEWALYLNECCKAFRHAGIEHNRRWTGREFAHAFAEHMRQQEKETQA